MWFSLSDAAAAENTPMTLTELSVFMKKQEMELQLRTEKEKEKEEGEFAQTHLFTLSTNSSHKNKCWSALAPKY